MADTPISGPMALRPKDAAKALGVSTRHLWTLTAQGHIPCVRVGSGKRQLVLYPVDVLRNWLARQATQAASSAAKQAS
jgi:excisionase family DNA binding protein